MQRQPSDASSTLTDALDEGAGAAQTQRIFRREHEFVRDDDADAENARRWETRMARRYYDALHKEYAICDLSRWREGAVGLRWRTAAEVTSGKGERICAARGCASTDGLRSFELPFEYVEQGDKKLELVKCRVCRSCSKKIKGRKRSRSRSRSRDRRDDRRDRDRSRRDRDDRRDRKKKKKEKSKAPVIPEADIRFMDTLWRDIQTMGPLRSNHLNAFYKRHPEIPPKGAGAGTWIAKRCEYYGLVVKKPEKYGGAMEFQLAPTSSRKLNIVADRQEDRPPSQLPEEERRKL